MMAEIPPIVFLVVFLIVAAVATIILFDRRSRGRSSGPSVAVREQSTSHRTTIADRTAYLTFLNDTGGNCFRRAHILGKSINFDGIKLANADFRDAVLEACSFDGADLADADFSGSNLIDVTFRNANLARTKMRNAQLSNVVFEGATLWNAELAEVSLTNTVLTNARLEGADLRGASLPEHLVETRFNSADLRFANFHPLTEIHPRRLLRAKYNFFTTWPSARPLAPLPLWPKNYPILPVIPLSLPLDSDAVSTDGLGPNPMYVHRALWGKCWFMRQETLELAAVKFGIDTKTQRQIRSAAKAKLDDLIATSEWFDIRGLADRWLKPTLSDLYERTAHDYRHYRFVFAEALETRPDVGELLKAYYDAILDLVTLAEYTQGALLQDGFMEMLAKPADRPQFESPLEEMFWTEWQEQGGARVIELQYQYTVPGANYRIDFVHLPKRIAIELDGYEYHSSKDQFTADRKRQRELESKGWRFIRFSGSEVTRDVSACFNEVRAFVENASQ